MFADKAIAGGIGDLMVEIGTKLKASVNEVKKDCSAAEFERYRAAVGHLMGEMLDIMNPIYSKHPELKPPEVG